MHVPDTAGVATLEGGGMDEGVETSGFLRPDEIVLVAVVGRVVAAGLGVL